MPNAANVIFGTICKIFDRSEGPVNVLGEDVDSR